MAQPFSPVQASMLRDSPLGAGGRHVEQVDLQIAPGLAVDRIMEAWRETVRATEALRMAFVVKDGEPLGWEETSAGAEMLVISGNSESWETRLATDRARPLAMDGGPPWRVAFHVEEGRFLWTFHHALLDGRSITQVLRSFIKCLAGGCEIPELKLARWSSPAPEPIAQAKDFYQQMFRCADQATVETLSRDDPPSKVSLSLGEDVAARLESAAAEMGVTAATLVSWAWGQALATATGGDHAIVGQVRAGTTSENRAGFTMNTVPLVIRRARKGSVRSELAEFRSLWLKIRDFSTVSPSDLPPGTFGDFDDPWPDGILMVERGTMHHQIGRTTEVESIVIHEQSGESLLAAAWVHPRLDLEIETSRKWHGSAIVSPLIDHWGTIITRLAECLTDEVEEITRLPDAVLDRLLPWENGGEAIGPSHLARAWNESVRRNSGVTALETPEGSFTYDELDARAGSLAAYLLESGITAGITVASMLGERGHLPGVMLALAKVDAIHVPIDPVLPVLRQMEILKDSGAAYLISDLANPIDAPGVQVLATDGRAACDRAMALPDDPRHVLNLLYTSGSTGAPKGVMMEHGGVINECRAMAGMMRLKPGDRVLQFSSPGFDASLEEVLATLLSGATLVPRSAGSATDFSHFDTFVRTRELTVVGLTTAFWGAWCAWLVADGLTIPETVHTVVIGGERLSASAMRDWNRCGGRSRRLLNTYGPTEVSIAATVELLHEWESDIPPPIGRPLPGLIARVGDAAGCRMPPGVAGELWLGGVGVSPGYWKRPDLTEDRFRWIDSVRYYRTGDKVCFDDHGNLHFLGRYDDQLKIRGHRVEPDEVVRVLEGFSGVCAAHVGPVGAAENVVLGAWIHWDAPPAADWPAQILAHARARLPGAAVPSRWAAVDGFQLTERGKLDRRSLPDPVLTAVIGGVGGAPNTETETRMAGIWGKVLGVDTVGCDDSFFDLGGHSLAALRLFARIAAEWGIRIPMARLIEAPTVRSLAGILDNHTESPAGGAASVVISLRDEGGAPPLFCIHGGDGGVIFYRNLAAAMAVGRRLTAIECPALGADAAVRMIPVEESAAAYIRAMREVQADGPYWLAGYSYGGLIAYEMAAQLLASGESVAFTGLFDTVNPAFPVREYSLLERAEVYWNAQGKQSFPGRFWRLIGRLCDGVVTHFKVRTETLAARSAGRTEPHSEIRMLQVRDAHWEAMRIYQPRPLAIGLTLFRTTAPDDKYELPDDYGWGGLVGNQEIIRLPGRHLTMFDPPYVADLARELALRINPPV